MASIFDAKVNNTVGSVKVEASVFAGVFSDLNELLKSISHTKFFTLSTSNGVLKVMCRTALEYVAEIPIKEQTGDDFEQAFLFTDVTKLMPKKGFYTIQYVMGNLSIETISGNLQLKSSVSKPLELELFTADEDVKKDILLKGIKNVLMTSSLSKAYSRSGTSVFFKGDKVLVQYPTAHFEFESSGFDTTLAFTNLKFLSHILSNYDVKIETLDRFIILASKDRSVRIPRTLPEVKLTDIKDWQYVTTIKATGLKSRILDLKAIAGQTSCTVTLLDKGMRLHVSGGDFNMTANLGQVEGSTVILSFNALIDTLVPLFLTVGEEFDIYKKGDIICIKGLSTVLTSVHF